MCSRGLGAFRASSLGAACIAHSPNLSRFLSGLFVRYNLISQVSPKQFDGTPCGCSRKCCTKVAEDQRRILFDGFWASGDFNTQNSYLCGCVKVIEPKRRSTPRAATSATPSRRLYSRVFYLNNKGISVEVCKTIFLRTYGISNGRMDRALRSQAKESGSPHMDQRGRHEPKNKTPDAVINVIKQHIESFPKYKSHYSRQDNPNKKYLSPELSISTMYSLYKEKMEKDAVDPASMWVYRKVFNESFNLSFGM